MIQGGAEALAVPLRFGGAHICSGLWVAGVVLYHRNIVLRIIGFILAHVFLATALIPLHLLPQAVFIPMFISMILWMGTLAWLGDEVIAKPAGEMRFG